jgi:molybdenum cofactor guanylyltransferase
MASAAILAGGRARRFGGRDESPLVVGGSPAQAGRHSYVEERESDSGPLGGPDAALAAARDDVLFPLACDMPFVTSAFLRYLAANAAGFEAVVPGADRGYHPLWAVYPRACGEMVPQLLAERKLAMVGLVEAVRTRVIESEDVERFGPGRRLLANVNTPGEFDRLEALLGHKL